MNKRTMVALAATAALVAGGGWYAHTRGITDEIGPEALAMAHRGDLEIVVTETGRIEPLTKVDVKSKVAGQVQAVRVQEGQQVKQGDVLLELDATDARHNLAQAEADRAVAQAELAGLTAGPRPADLAEAQANLQEALARQHRADEERTRARKALAANSLTPREWDLARGEADEADAAVAAAHSKLARVEAGAAPDEVAEARAKLRKAEVALQSAHDQLAYCVVRSPITGTVIHRGIQVGEMVTPGVAETGNREPLLTVADLSQLVVESNINQIDVGKLGVGQTVTIRVDTLPGEAFHGDVYKVAPAAVEGRDKDVQLFPVEVRVDPHGEKRLKPGMSADIDIFVRKKTDVLLLPIEAVARDVDGDGLVTLVHKKSNGQWAREKRMVRLGSSNESEIEIRSGLKEGDQVYIDPAPARDNTNHF